MFFKIKVLIRRIKNFGILSIIGIVLASCANIVMPSGGPKDQAAPEIVESTPPNYTTNFNGKKIIIKFNEYIQLRNVNQSLIICPSLPEKPKVLAKGKTLLIDINNELEDSTTYAFNFGNSIADITEGNAQEDFRYVFSTGDYLDSLIIAGSVINAFDLKSEKEVFVLLYDIYEDSIPYKEQARYIAKTNKSGEFTLSNLKAGAYKIFALKDANSNFLFDMPNEKIAFLDTLIIPFAEYIEKIDTIRLDTNALDSINTDSIVNNSLTMFYPRDIILHLFEEYHSEQFVLNTTREERGKCVFIFNESTKDSAIIEPLYFKIDSANLIFESNPGKDTIVCWINDSLIYKNDTLDFIVSYYKLDSLDQSYLQTDTFSLKYKAPTKKKKNEIVENDTILTINFSVYSGKKIDLYKDLILSFDAPIINIDTSKIELYEVIDSIETKIDFNFFQDSSSFRKYHVNHSWNEEKAYKIIINSYAFTDIYFKTNDTIQSLFSVEKAESYGTLSLNVKNLNEAVIIQFMNSKDLILKEFYISQDQNIYIPFLKPGDYHTKIIFDKNSNKIWDTGKYLEHNQPEKVMFNNDPINIRANWDLELDLDLIY